VLLALSLIGVPPLPGFWTKILVLIGLAQEGAALHLTALAAILLVTAIEASYLFRFAIKLYRKSDQPPAPHRALDIGAAAMIGIAVVVVTVQIDPVGDKLRAVARQAADRTTYISTVFPPEQGFAATEDSR